MHKWAMAALLIVASVMGIVYTIETIVVAEKEKADEVVQENELRFIASNYKFEKDEYVVQVGDTMDLTLKNEEGRHGLAIPELDISIVEGDKLSYTFDTPGTYEIECSIGCGPGHPDMKTVLIVSEEQLEEQPTEETTEH